VHLFHQATTTPGGRITFAQEVNGQTSGKQRCPFGPNQQSASLFTGRKRQFLKGSPPRSGKWTTFHLQSYCLAKARKIWGLSLSLAICKSFATSSSACGCCNCESCSLCFYRNGEIWTHDIPAIVMIAHSSERDINWSLRLATKLKITRCWSKIASYKQAPTAAQGNAIIGHVIQGCFEGQANRRSLARLNLFALMFVTSCYSAQRCFVRVQADFALLVN